MLKFVVSLLTVVVLLPASVSSSAPQDTPSPSHPLTVGVLRRDGVVVPFASHDGERWSHIWREPAVAMVREAAPALSDVPKPWWPTASPVLIWAAWPLSERARIIAIEKATVISPWCVVQIGLQSTYKSAEAVPTAEERPFPKDGIAADGPAAVRPLTVLDPTTADWRIVTEALALPVLKSETEHARHGGVRSKKASDQRERAGTRFTLEVLVRADAPVPGLSLYYFEGTKRYVGPPLTLWGGEQRPCDRITFAKGWVHRLSDGTFASNVFVTSTDCTRAGLTNTLPLAALTVADKPFWIVQESDPIGERYKILDAADPKFSAVLETIGGWCR
ncbi:MAG TPA: hypothetical protein VGK32_01080 [Vicinamibacterales bacterium]|jgi:hypothetical protein